jgi:hypothetical protein
MSKLITITAMLALASCQAPLRSAQAEPHQQVFRDASGARSAPRSRTAT